MRCRDCGTPDYNRSDTRGDICHDCMELRVELVKAIGAKLISLDEFHEVQRAIAIGRGTGANAIRRVLGLASPEI